MWRRRAFTGFRAQGPVLAVAVAVAGAGVVGWILAYTLLRPWQALIVAVGMAVALAGVVAARARSFRPAELLAFVPAFALLTWPPAWLVVVFVRYWISGKTVGS